MHSQRKFACTYEGERDIYQRPSGLGRLTSEMKQSKIIFTGQFRRGISEGHGVLRLEDYSVFAGQFVDGNVKGYGLYTTATGSIIRGYFLNEDLVSLKGSVVFSDGTAGVPFHEGSFSEDKKFVAPEKFPNELLLAQSSADRAFELERMYENKDMETLTEASEMADTISVVTSNILDLDQFEQAVAECESER